MSNIAIRVENLSKLYHIGRAQQRHDTLRDALVASARDLASKLQNSQSRTQPSNVIWALKDVSFEIKRGEVVGIIGRNGAGKSTLLKILSRITEPTGGRALIHGRVGSLLEVGTGFHPELTGRENVYLNGAILGMRNREIDQRFDEIVAFAEIEKFLDTPVKRYSSGMYVRLAFAVAAHLEPEILLVDEVLAVGDAAFQRKCLGKMGDVAHEGRTVLFVSHNLSAIQTICVQGLFLSDGKIAQVGPAAHVVDSYIRALQVPNTSSLQERQDRLGKGDIQLREVHIGLRPSRNSDCLFTGSPARFIFELTGTAPGLYCRFTIYDSSGRAQAHFNSSVRSQSDIVDISIGSAFVCDIEELLLSPGRYWVNVAIYDRRQLQDHVEAAAWFDVESGSVRGRSISYEAGYGAVCLPHRWINGVPD